MNRGGQAKNIEDINNLNMDDQQLCVSNCGYFIAENTSTAIKNEIHNDGFLLIYQHKGSAIILEQNKSITITEGSIILFKPKERTVITYCADTINERYYVYFSGEQFEKYLKELNIYDKRFHHVGDLSETIPIFHRIIEDFKRHNLDNNVYRSTYLLNILTTIGKVLEPKQQIVQPSIFREILFYISSNYNIKLTIDSLSEKFSISTTTLNRYFRNYTKQSPIEYINNVRLKKAKFFLLETDLPIQEIAFSTGFDDALYFSKFFKSKSGLSPKSFRKKYNSLNAR